MLLYRTNISDEKREINNSNDYLLVILATVILFFSLYLFSDLLGFLKFPSAQDLLLKWKMIYSEPVRGIHTVIGFSSFAILEQFRKVTGFFIGFFILCFLTTYFLPVRLKRANNIFFYMLFSSIVIDFWQLILLIFLQLIIYSSFHLRFLNKFPRINLVRFTLVNAPILIALLKIAGINLFSFWFVFIFATQWFRLILYYCDFRDGYVPNNLSFINYASIFFNLPSMVCISNMIGQSYAYIESNFLHVDKNIVVRKGIKLIVLSMLYVVFEAKILMFIYQRITGFDFQIFFPLQILYDQYSQGNIKSPFTVLFSAQFYFLAHISWRAYTSHFKVGLWNLLGYDIHPNVDKPFLATNFISFFSRYMYHNRFFLFRIFYYPIAAKFKTYSHILRILISIALILGPINLLLHLYEHAHMNYKYPISKEINAWPYYFFLIMFFSLTQVYFLKVKTKTKPWHSIKTLIVDIFFAYSVFIIYSIINILILQRPLNISFDANLGIFLKGLGIY